MFVTSDETIGLTAGPQPGKPLRILQVFTFYENYLAEFYSRNPNLIEAPYAEQLAALIEDGFGGLHVLTPSLRKLGHETEVIIANCAPLQVRWYRERGLTPNPNHWMHEILAKQIESFSPDVFYTLNPLTFDGRFVRSLNPRPKLIVGWRAAEIPAGTDWNGFDLMLSHLSVCRSKSLQLGVKQSEFFHPAVSPELRARVVNTGKDYDVVFTGQWTGSHSGRNRIISELVQFCDDNRISLGLFLSAQGLPLPPHVARANRGAVWGGDMYRVLRSGRIVINAEIDLAEGEAGNMRFFETLTCGSFLLTQRQKNVSSYFEVGKEIDCFSTIDELKQKILFYLENADLREQIARRGAERGTHDYSLDRMAEKFIEIVRTQMGECMADEQMTIQPGGVPGLIDRALDLVDRRDFRGALQLLEASPADRPIQDRQLVMALCHAELGDLNQARVYLERELGAFPGNQSAVDMFEKLGLSPSHDARDPMPGVQQRAEEAIRMFNAGDLSGSIKCLEALCKDQPKVAGVNLLLTQVLNAVGRHEEALEAAKRELELNPSNVAAREQVEKLSRALLKSSPPLLHPEQRSYQSELPNDVLNSIQNASHNYSYKGIPMIKNPFDFALYPQLLWNVRPKTIIEIGSKNGGSAVWMGDMIDNFGLDCRVVSIDIVRVDDVSHPRVTFMEGDGRNLSGTLTEGLLSTFPRPWLVIEDADHSYETSSAVLKFFHPRLIGGEYIVIEDGIISDLNRDASCNSGPHRAIREHIAAHPGEYDMDSQYLDYFGKNFTWCTNGFLRKKKYPLNPLVSKVLIKEFNEDDPAPTGVESQMSLNERFQLYSALRSYVLPQAAGKVMFAEIGSYAGASLMLSVRALRRGGRQIEGISVEPGGQEQFYQLLPSLPEVRHLRAFSNAALPEVARMCQSHGGLDFIFVDGDHSYEGVADDIRNYYPLLKEGGVIAFHDFLPELSDQNRDAIFYHHGGKEPGIRRACLELMEGQFGCKPLSIEVPYPADPTQTQPHLPVIPGVVTTVRMYQKSKGA